jgi:hypothetical protein
MTPDEIQKQVTENLDLTGQVMANGATIAPDYVMRTVIAMRERAKRHTWHPHRLLGPQCDWCGRDWPCADVRTDLTVLGIDPEGDDD